MGMILAVASGLLMLQAEVTTVFLDLWVLPQNSLINYQFNFSKDLQMTTTTIRKQRHQRHKRLPKGERGGIELLLIQNVEHLGKQGEVVEVVRDTPATTYSLRGLQQLLPNITRMVEKHKEKLTTIARERLAGLRDCSGQPDKRHN